MLRWFRTRLAVRRIARRVAIARAWERIETENPYLPVEQVCTRVMAQCRCSRDEATTAAIGDA